MGIEKGFDRFGVHSKFMKATLSLLLIICELCSFSQSYDTTFYKSGAIRDIRNKDKTLLVAFYTMEGEDLNKQDSFTYSYFDEDEGMKREIVVKNALYEEYFLRGNDTIYNEFHFGPEFSRQWDKYVRYMARTIAEYPAEARKNNIEGKVILSMIINKQGKFTEIKALTDVGYGLEDSAIRLIMGYKNWGVIYHNNRPVNLFIRMPFDFKLE